MCSIFIVLSLVIIHCSVIVSGFVLMFLCNVGCLYGIYVGKV